MINVKGTWVVNGGPMVLKSLKTYIWTMKDTPPLRLAQYEPT